MRNLQSSPGRSTDRVPTEGYFAFVFAGRTGSSYVVQCLNSMPKVLCYHELLWKGNDEERQPWQDRVLGAIADGTPVESFFPDAVPERFHPIPPTEKAELTHVGFKTKLHHIHDHDHFERYLTDHSFKVIYLHRENVVKAAVSEVNGRRLRSAHKSWNVTSRDKLMPQVEILPAKLKSEIKRREDIELIHRSFYERLTLPKLELTYEQMLANESSFFDTMLGFLGIDSTELAGSFLKNTPNDLSKALTNFDQLRDAFEGTPYFDMFTS